MMNIADVVIIGGGVCGCALARELAVRGIRVTVIERDHIAAHASGKSWGGLYPASGAGIPGPLAEPAKRAAGLHTDLYGVLKDETGIDYQLRPTETITLARDDSDLADLETEAGRLLKAGFEAELLSAERVIQLEPHVTSEIAGGMLQGAQQELDSFDFTRALAESARRRGARIITGNASSVKSSNGRVEAVVMDSGDTIPANSVVLATGPWAGRSELEGVPRFPMKPVKGEILRIRLPGREFRHRVGHGGHNLGRKPDGLVWAGTTEWNRGFDERPSESGRRDILNGAASIAPVMRSGEVVTHTACLRPVTDDGLPIIGALGATAGLWALAGAGKKGVLLSLALAEMVAGALRGSAEDATIPFSIAPGRFGL